MVNSFPVLLCFPPSQTFQVMSAITHEPYAILNTFLISSKKKNPASICGKLKACLHQVS